MLGEDDELAPVPMGVEHLGIVLQEPRELVPFAVGPRLADFESGLLQVAEQFDFGLEFGDGARGSRLVQHLLLGRLQLGIGGVLDLVQVVGIECGQAVGHLEADLVASLEKLLFAKPLFEPLAAAAKRLKNRLGRRRKPALQDGQREADGPLAAFAFEGLGPVEFLADVVRHAPVKFGLGIRKGIGHGVGDPLGEERRTVEFEQLFLDQTAHHVRSVSDMDAVAEFPLKAIPVEQSHKKLKIRLLAVMRGRRQKQEMPGQRSEELPKAVALRVLDLVAEIGRAQLVGFVADDQVPVGLFELRPNTVVTAELVQSCDDERIFLEPVAGAGRLQLVVGHDLERQVKPPVELVLPLLRQVSRAYDQAAVQVAPGHQLLDEEARHDGFTCARVVGQQETERLPWQHRVVNRRDLVRERIDQGRVDGQQRVKKVSEPDAVGLRHEPELGAVAIEAPGLAHLRDFKGRLPVPVKQLIPEAPRRILVGHLDGNRAYPFDVEDRDEPFGQDAANRAASGDVFKTDHGLGHRR